MISINIVDDFPANNTQSGQGSASLKAFERHPDRLGCAHDLVPPCFGNYFSDVLSLLARRLHNAHDYLPQDVCPPISDDLNDGGKWYSSAEETLVRNDLGDEWDIADVYGGGFHIINILVEDQKELWFDIRNPYVQEGF